MREAKACTQCHILKPMADFCFDKRRPEGRTSECRQCKGANTKKWWKRKGKEYGRLYAAGWRDRNREHFNLRSKLNQRKKKARINLPFLEEQKGLCAICLNVLQLGRKTHLDHDHKTGKFRGLLCHACNTTLGKVKEDTRLLQRFIDYIEKHKEEVA